MLYLFNPSKIKLGHDLVAYLRYFDHIGVDISTPITLERKAIFNSNYGYFTLVTKSGKKVKSQSLCINYFSPVSAGPLNASDYL